MHRILTRIVENIWQTQNIASTLLLPLSWLVQAAIAHKKKHFQSHPERVWNSPVPVIVVGNIYVGGTGKTPVVMALIQALQQRGWRPGVISRGYGVKIGPAVRTGRGRLDPDLFGDEPALIAQATDAPVAVHPERVRAAQTLRQHYPDVDVIIADDGLQHLALGRDLEIIVQDTRGIGNGRLLPAGPLREPPARLQHVHVIITNQPSGLTSTTQPSPETAKTFNAGRPLQIAMTLIPQAVTHISSGQTTPWAQWLEQQRQIPVSAIAAIGHPERFFTMLRQHGLSLAQAQALPDHAKYTAASFKALTSQTILITAKDAVKCHGLNDSRLHTVHVLPRFSSNDWLDTLHQTLLDTASKKANMTACAAKH